MSSNEKKRGSSPGTTKEKTPSKKPRRGSSSLGRPSKAANFVAAEDVALCKAYVNVTLNPIDGVEQKASSFWDHIHRKFCLLLKPDNPSEALPDRDSESLKNRFQRQIQKKMNVYNRYYKQVKECPPSGTTEEEWYKIAADNYRDAEGHSFAFLHCVEILQQLPKFNPMIDDADRSSDVVAEDSDADKKPAASVNKIGAPMGAALKRPPGSKKAKKELLLSGTSLSASTANAEAIQGLARSHKSIAKTMNVKEQMASVQMEFAMYRELGDDVSARQCIESLKHLRAKLSAMEDNEANTPSSFTGVTNASSSTAFRPPVEEVDLTGGDQMYPSKERTNAEVDLTNSGVDDNEAEKDVEEMYGTDLEAAEV
jgi:hypothetical protein